MPSATVRCARIEPASPATQQLRVDKSSDLECSVYAPSSRFSGASCTSLIPIARLRRQPVDAGTFTFESLYCSTSRQILGHRHHNSASFRENKPSKEGHSDIAVTCEDQGDLPVRLRRGHVRAGGYADRWMRSCSRQVKLSTLWSPL